MIGTLDFSNSAKSKLYDELKNKYYNPSTKVKSQWEFDDINQIATFKW